MRPFKIQLTVEELMEKSRDMTGVDIVDEEAVEPLSVLHQSLCEEANLDEEGARAHTSKLLRILANRLRMKRDFQKHPEILEQEIKGPLIIMGMARTGTTKTQKALAATGDFNWLPYWQCFNWASMSGEPNEATEARIAEADAFCRWLDARSPQAKLAHSFEALEPEEDTVLTEGSLVAVSFQGYASIPGYIEWFIKQPPGILFEFLRDTLKYLQWQGLADPAKPWLLKSPAYNGLELEILKVFPAARLVETHRTPVKTLPSVYKYVQHLRKAFTGQESTVEGGSISGPEAIAMLSGLNYSLSIRHENPEIPKIDLRFDDVTAEFSKVAKKIYDHIGLLLTEDSLQRIRQWETENAMHKYGSYQYSLKELGIEEEFLRENMADYFELLRSLDKK